MKYWKESQSEVRKVMQDREMAKSLLRLIETRMKALEILDRVGRKTFKIKSVVLYNQ